MKTFCLFLLLTTLVLADDTKRSGGLEFIKSPEMEKQIKAIKFGDFAFDAYKVSDLKISSYDIGTVDISGNGVNFHPVSFELNGHLKYSIFTFGVNIKINVKELTFHYGKDPKHGCDAHGITDKVTFSGAFAFAPQNIYNETIKKPNVRKQVDSEIQTKMCEILGKIQAMTV